jgi:hypothetical protein
MNEYTAPTLLEFRLRNNVALLHCCNESYDEAISKQTSSHR